MSELILQDRIIELSQGAQVGDRPKVRIQLTETRLIVSALNADADDLLDGELVLPADLMRELFAL